MVSPYTKDLPWAQCYATMKKQPLLENQNNIQVLENKAKSKELV